MRKTIKTTKKQIVEYWTNNPPYSEIYLMFDWADAEQCCWACGHSRNLERCHIIPNTLNGSDTPDNYVLLCNSCHKLAPNVNSKQAMWDWLRNIREITPSMGMPMSLGLIYAINQFTMTRLVEMAKNVNFEKEFKKMMIDNISNHAFDTINQSTMYYGLIDLENKLQQIK